MDREKHSQLVKSPRTSTTSRESDENGDCCDDSLPPPEDITEFSPSDHKCYSVFLELKPDTPGLSIYFSYL